MKTATKRSVAVFVAMQLMAGAALAQESAYADLNTCTKNEQLKLTAKGAAVGALAGLGGALFGGKKDNAGKAALAGALVGGVAGFATAYYTAIDTCKKLNPNWITESSLIRDPAKSLEQVYKDNHYNKRDGIQLRMQGLDTTATVKAGEPMAIEAVYDVMTPDNAETQVQLSRKLFVTTDGKETELTFPLAANASRTVEAGRNKETMQLPTPSNVGSGTVYRVELSAKAGDKAPVTMSKNVTVI